ncbi:MAG: 4'-phosphopantetheinyl transferase superfamily protein [Firmicutes bacterium]|nr:4'-phosphopantetheinyl transferase superfamily protein [Bacillota bacterium]
MDIYAVRSNWKINSHYFDSLIKFLPTVEQNKINKYLKWEDAQKSLIGKILIRSIVINKYGFKNKGIHFSINEFGKPYLKDIKEFNFNISHSGEWVVCAVDTRPIGIDIEEINDFDFNIANNFFSTEEYSDLMNQDKMNRLEYFFDLWTLKESYIKMIGTGLSKGLDFFTMKKTSDNIWTNGSDKTYYFKQYNTIDGYKTSVCAMNKNFPTDINTIKLKQFIKNSMNSL